MKALCDKIHNGFAVEVDGTYIPYLLEPTDLDRAALHWACPLAKNKGQTTKTTMLWEHRSKGVWILFHKVGKAIECYADSSREELEDTQAVLACDGEPTYKPGDPEHTEIMTKLRLEVAS